MSHEGTFLYEFLLVSLFFFSSFLLIAVQHLTVPCTLGPVTSKVFYFLLTLFSLFVPKSRPSSFKYFTNILGLLLLLSFHSPVRSDTAYFVPVDFFGLFQPSGELLRYNTVTDYFSRFIVEVLFLEKEK